MRSVFNDLSNVANTPVVKKITEEYNISVEELIYLYRTGKVKDIKGIGEKKYSELHTVLKDFLPEDYWYLKFYHVFFSSAFDTETLPAFFDNEAYELFFKNSGFSEEVEEFLNNLGPVELDTKELAFSCGDFLRAVFQEHLTTREISKRFEISVAQVNFVLEKTRLKIAGHDFWWKLMFIYYLFGCGYTPETLFLELCDMRMAGIDPFYCQGRRWEETNEEIGKFLQREDKLEKARHNIRQVLDIYRYDYVEYYQSLAKYARQLNPGLFKPKFDDFEEYSLIFRNRDTKDRDYLKCKSAATKLFPILDIDTSVEKLNLSNRSTNILVHNQIRTIRDIVNFSEDELRGIKGLGNCIFREIYLKILSLGYELRKD